MMLGFPIWSFEPLKNGLAEGVPVLVNERWPPHRSFPTLVVSLKVRKTPSSCARNVSSTAPSRITAPGKSVVNLGFTPWWCFEYGIIYFWSRTSTRLNRERSRTPHAIQKPLVPIEGNGGWKLAVVLSC